MQHAINLFAGVLFFFFLLLFLLVNLLHMIGFLLVGTAIFIFTAPLP